MVDGVFALQDDLRDGDEAVALTAHVIEDGGQGLRRVFAGIVEQHDAAALQLPRYPPRDLLRADTLPVETVRVPYSLKPFCELPQKFYLNIDTSICKSYNIEKCNILQKSLFEVWYGNQA